MSDLHNQDSVHVRSVVSAYAHRGGFTMLEMLIVAAVIALLAAMFVPSLARARALAALAVCQSRLHHWGQAFVVYAAENNGYYPHADGLDRDKGPADRFGWVDVLPPILGERPWRDHRLFHKPGPDSIFQCPAARILPDSRYRYRPSREGYFSYAMNSCLELDEDCWRAPGDDGVPMPSFLKTCRIVQPGRVVLLFDQLLDPQRGYDGKEPYRKTGKYCGSYPKAFSIRHRRQDDKLGGTILYCDGHSEWTDSVWKPSWPAEMEVPPRDDPNWFPYPH